MKKNSSAQGRIRSSVPNIGWPGIPTNASASLASLLYQLDHSQWWTPDQLENEQYNQLARVLQHAYRTIPFYAERIASTDLEPAKLATRQHWSKLPLLTRRELQTADPPILSNSVPDLHGRVAQSITSGSTGQPVVVSKASIAQLYWIAFAVRDHLWHGRDFGGTLASIRYTKPDVHLPPAGGMRTYWNERIADLFPTGPAFVLNIRSSVEEQLAWLRRLEPRYLLTYPSVAMELAQHLHEHSLGIDGLVELRTFGEVLDDTVRNYCRDALRVPISDIYTSQEVGYIAIQCPEDGEPRYHVQSENVFVEVLDQDNQPCRPGQTGKIVVSTLHNFATPLLRYEIGDYGEVGDACSCGRGLPVIRRILGRERNLMTFPNGERRWPGFAEGDRPQHLPPFYQFQLVQTALDQIEARVVLDKPWTTQEEEVVRNHLHRSLGYPFRLTFNYVEEIPRSPTGKFEEFRSEI